PEERPAPEQPEPDAQQPQRRELHDRLEHPDRKGSIVSARFASLSSRAQVAVIAAALLLVAVLGYFALIAPKRSTAASLKRQTASVQAAIDRNRSTGFTKALPAVRSARVFSLAEAMPSQLDTPDVLLSLNQLANASGLSFDQAQPTAASANASTTGATDPFAAQPILVKFSG